MKAAIIIITYNNQQDVVQAIESVRNQTFNSWQCITIDNGSTDNTFRVINNMVVDDPRFTTFKKLNEGPSAGRNLGFSKIDKDTEYVHFLDGDDMLDPNFMSKMVLYMDNHTQVGLLGCQYDMINENGDFLTKGNRSRFGIGALGFPKMLGRNIKKTPFESLFAATGQGAFAVFRTRIFRQTEGYEKAFWSHEDSDIFCQMALLSEVHYIPDHLYQVRLRQNSLSRSETGRPSLFREKWDFYQSVDPAENLLIENSLKYYYTRHKPLRDLKVGLKALREFFTENQKHSLHWAIECFKSGFLDLFLQRTYKTRIQQRAPQVEESAGSTKDLVIS